MLFVFWLALHNILQKNKLFQWGISDNDTCVLCNDDKEEIGHLFFECPFSRGIRCKVLRAVNVERGLLTWTREVSWFTRKAYGKTLLARHRRPTLAASIYVIWRFGFLLFFNRGA